MCRLIRLASLLAWLVPGSVPAASTIESRPPTIVRIADGISECKADSSATTVTSDVIHVAVTVAYNGKLETHSVESRSHPWTGELVTCALDKIEFAPALRNGVRIAGVAHLKLQVRAREDRSDELRIERVGPLITHPGMIHGDTDVCFPTDPEYSRRLSQFVVTFNVKLDGAIENVTLPVGSEPWQETVARCVLERSVFQPGTVDGVPVDSEAQMPIVMRPGGRKFQPPGLRSSVEQLEAAYRACYPADQISISSAVYRFEVTSGGRVRNPKIMKGSGDERLDQAGLCILGMLEFAPLKQDGRVIRSQITWELPIRPPR